MIKFFKKINSILTIPLMVNLIQINGFLLSILISISFEISNAAEGNRDQKTETNASIIKSQNEAYNASLFKDCVMKDANRIKLKKQLRQAESDLKATESRLRQFPKNENFISLHSSHLKIFNEATDQYEQHHKELIEKFNFMCIDENNRRLISGNCCIKNKISQSIMDITLSPFDIQRHILGITFVSSILQHGHAKHLKFVCKNWNKWLTNDIYFNDLVKDFSVEITEEDMYDKTGSIIQKLKNNHQIVNLTFNFEGYEDKQWDNAWYNNYNNLIIEGLQNKPNLKVFKINGLCIASDFLKTFQNVDDTDPEYFLNLPHLVFLKTLEEFHISEEISGAGDPSQKIYFLNILAKKYLTPKLHTVVYRAHNGAMFKIKKK